MRPWHYKVQTMCSQTASCSDAVGLPSPAGHAISQGCCRYAAQQLAQSPSPCRRPLQLLSSQLPVSPHTATRHRCLTTMPVTATAQPYTSRASNSLCKAHARPNVVSVRPAVLGSLMVQELTHSLALRERPLQTLSHRPAAFWGCSPAAHMCPPGRPPHLRL